MMKTIHKVSLIVPVYNVEKYLQQCIDSILSQTYTNIEIIIINDGSTDNSFEICKTYDSKCDNLTLINQKNAGLSAARNAGLNVATGDYVAFLDSDDWLDSDFISNMVDAIERTGADIVESGIRWKYPSYEREEAFEKNVCLEMRDALGEYLLQTKPIHSAVWCKLYRMFIFENLRFAEGRLHEDGFFTYQAMYKCLKYATITYVGYNYRQNREGSIMSIRPQVKNICDVMDMMEERIAFFYDREEKELAEKAEAYYYRTSLTNYVTALTLIKDVDLANELKYKLNKNRKNIFKNRYLSLRKIKFVFFFYCPAIFHLKYMR